MKKDIVNYLLVLTAFMLLSCEITSPGNSSWIDDLFKPLIPEPPFKVEESDGGEEPSVLIDKGGQIIVTIDSSKYDTDTELQGLPEPQKVVDRDTLTQQKVKKIPLTFVNAKSVKKEWINDSLKIVIELKYEHSPDSVSFTVVSENEMSEHIFGKESIKNGYFLFEKKYSRDEIMKYSHPVKRRSSSKRIYRYIVIPYYNSNEYFQSKEYSVIYYWSDIEIRMPTRKASRKNKLVSSFSFKKTPD